MSNFAERLVARSAGVQPVPGFAMLRPRPVSRFEPMAGLENDATADAEPQVQTPIADEMLVKAPAAVRSPNASRASHRPENEAPDAIARPREHEGRAPPAEAAQPPPPVAGEERQPRPARDPPRRETVVAPTHAREVHVTAEAPANPASQAGAGAAETHVTSQPPAIESISPPASREAVVEIRTVRSEQLASLARERLPPFREAKAEPPPAPTISIGRIEVQFLPQESRSPAPQPERTRGFAAYARARRGEPR